MNRQFDSTYSFPCSDTLSWIVKISNIMSFLRNPLVLLGLNISAIAGSTLYLRSHHVYNLEEHEARMDELEGMYMDMLRLVEKRQCLLCY